MKCYLCKKEVNKDGTPVKHYKCKKCQRKKAKEAYKKNPEKFRKRRAEWKKNNPEREKKMNAKYRMKLKKEVLEHYGGIECKCCGETEIKFLGIDHMDNDGYLERRFTGGGHAFYRWLKSNNFPKRNYKVMCQNCNSARYYYGKCPHQK